MVMGMRTRIGWAVVLVALAGGVTFAEVTGRLGGASVVYREWLGVRAEVGGVTRVEIDSAADVEEIEPLDAALLLRAIEGFEPLAVVFMDPVVGGANEALLESKLAGIAFPVVFGGAGEKVPADLGSAFGAVATIEFGDLMVDKMRAEQGLISPKLDGLFRGRIVECGLRGVDAGTVVERKVVEDWWWGILPVMLVGSVPFWRGGRVDRLVPAAILVGCWLLAALAVGPEFGVVLPVFAVGLLPVVSLLGGRR